ncbi:MAG: sigma-70 family RNA polymerase sigma factor [Bacteroidetes bacterium]|nr:sigma-70 family RNA polymerase sigma factor [Bacteroidota bacterium]HET6243135.1 sigma-70 family RNA polymerase sigma factor [Bacteroidia bacterium]
MSQDKNIIEIVSGCKNGDKKCQEMLYKMYYGKMMVICLRYTNDSDEAKDILQEGFIKVFNSLSKFDFIGSFEGWLRRIMVNTAIDNFRKNKSAIKLFDTNIQLENIDFVEEDPEENLISKKIKTADLLEAIQRLSPAYKTVFNLYAVDGYSHQQIANELNISIGTSKSNYSKAKQNLKKILQLKLVNNESQ